MINNRQGGRRRGRGGGGSGRVPSGAPSGNRQDNRQRGNAAQLLEKYKQLARDAQMGGDRVQSETYLQFAEHYFRVLNENRPRFEDQRPRGRDDEYGDEDEGDEDMIASDGDDGSQEEERVERPRREYQARDRGDNRERGETRERPEGRERYESRERSDNRDRPENRERSDNRDRPENRERADNRERPDNRERADNRERQEARPEAEPRNGETRFAARPRRPRRDANGEGAAGNDAEESRIALDILPPAISAAPAPSDAADDEEQPRPRRRTRRPRADDTGEPAPAAA